jgi:hypothetical protein
MTDYTTPNWDQLKATILKFYDADRNEQRYTERDLLSFVRVSQDNTITSVNKFRTYQRKFCRIAGWLHGKGKITNDNMNRYFWRGLSKSLRGKIEARILITNPRVDLTTAFDIPSITAAVEKIFMRNRFDVDDSDNEAELDWPETLSDSENEAGEDSEIEYRRRPIKKFSAKEPHEVERRLEKPRKGIRSSALIKKLGHMSLDDPDYGMLYYRAITMDPRVEKIIRPPQISTTGIQRLTSTAPRTPPRLPFECFGCGEKNHNMNSCPGLNELMSQGVIKRGNDGKYTMADGSRILREPGESLVKAAQRHGKSINPPETSNFITAATGRLSSAQATALASFPDDYDDEPVDNVHAVQRQPRVNKERRAERFAGVFPPPLSHARAKVTEATHEEASQEQASSIPVRVKQEPVSIPVPLDIHDQAQTFDPDDDDDIIMDDSPQARTKAAVRKPRLPHASQISKTVDPRAILDKAFNAPITLTVREIIGVSKEVSSLMQDAIRYRRTAEVEQNVSAAVTTANPPKKKGVAYHQHNHRQGTLIKITLECDGHPIRAIIDTGSTLNIMHQQVYEKAVRRPINRGVTPVMNDANGGGKIMAGLVENVPLLCGSVITWADLYVAGHVPFDLLLGRPWQRGNFVSIEERTDGTYVVFKDPKDPDVHYELLGVPEAHQSRFAYSTQALEHLNDVLPKDSDVFYSFTEEENECEARTCHGSHLGIRPKASYIHEVLFPSAWDENDTIEYQVCSMCNRASKNNSQGGKLLKRTKIVPSYAQKKQKAVFDKHQKTQPPYAKQKQKAVTDNYQKTQPPYPEKAVFDDHQKTQPPCTERRQKAVFDDHQKSQPPSDVMLCENLFHDDHDDQNLMDFDETVAKVLSHLKLSQEDYDKANKNNSQGGMLLKKTKIDPLYTGKRGKAVIDNHQKIQPLSDDVVGNMFHNLNFDEDHDTLEFHDNHDSNHHKLTDTFEFHDNHDSNNHELADFRRKTLDSKEFHGNYELASTGLEQYKNGFKNRLESTKLTPMDIFPFPFFFASFPEPSVYDKILLQGSSIINCGEGWDAKGHYFKCITAPNVKLQLSSSDYSSDGLTVAGSVSIQFRPFDTPTINNQENPSSVLWADISYPKQDDPEEEETLFRTDGTTEYHPSDVLFSKSEHSSGIFGDDESTSKKRKKSDEGTSKKFGKLRRDSFGTIAKNGTDLEAWEDRELYHADNDERREKIMLWRQSAEAESFLDSDLLYRQD